MAHYLLIILLFIPVNLVAGKHLLLITQQEDTFVLDGYCWQSFFEQSSGTMPATRLKSFTADEVKSVFNNLSYSLKDSDTLYFIVSAHTVKYGNCTLLRIPDLNDINLARDYVFRDDYEAFLSALNVKKIRVLLIINSCEPHTVIPTSFTMKFQYLTIMYSDENYSLFIQGIGSLASQLLNGLCFSDLDTLVNYLNHAYLDEALYHGYDDAIKQDIKELYPQQSIIYGNNISFR